jgi:hypothetical protein
MEKIGIFGLGLIGSQRLSALNYLGWNSSNLLVLDPNIQKVDNLNSNLRNFGSTSQIQLPL